MIIPNIWENKNVPNHQPDIGQFFKQENEPRKPDWIGPTAKQVE